MDIQSQRSLHVSVFKPPQACMSMPEHIAQVCKIE